MNLVFCTHKLADGGAERVISMWIKGFVAQGNQVSIILREAVGDVYYDLPKCVSIFYLKEENSRILGFISRIKNLRFLLDKINPDYVITALGPWGLWAYLASIGQKRIVINTEHNTFERPDSAPLSWGQNFYKYYVNKLFPFITVLTQADKDYIGKRLKNVVVLPNPLAFDIPQKIPLKKKQVIAVGRLDAWHVKGFDVLLKAWNIIATRYPEWQFLLIGPGNKSAIDYLRSLVRPELIDKQIKFTGSCSNMLDYYQPTSILVSSSRYEGLGMVIFEAMSQGCSCIASDYKGRQREIIRNESEGMICDTDNVQSLIDKLSFLIENDDYRINVQRNSMERAHYYSLDNIMDIWNKLLPIK